MILTSAVAMVVRGYVRGSMPAGQSKSNDARVQVSATVLRRIYANKGKILSDRASISEIMYFKLGEHRRSTFFSRWH